MKVNKKINKQDLLNNRIWLLRDNTGGIISEWRYIIVTLIQTEDGWFYLYTINGCNATYILGDDRFSNIKQVRKGLVENLKRKRDIDYSVRYVFKSMTDLTTFLFKTYQKRKMGLGEFLLVNNCITEEELNGNVDEEKIEEIVLDDLDYRDIPKPKEGVLIENFVNSDNDYELKVGSVILIKQKVSAGMNAGKYKALIVTEVSTSKHSKRYYLIDDNGENCTGLLRDISRITTKSGLEYFKSVDAMTEALNKLPRFEHEGNKISYIFANFTDFMNSFRGQ